jgi:hypothetical protein
MRTALPRARAVGVGAAARDQFVAQRAQGGGGGHALAALPSASRIEAK